MAERYSKLYSLKENQYILGSPVIIRAGALLLDNATTKVLAQLKFKSISTKIINEVSVSIQPKDATGNALGSPTVHTYIELNMPREVEFGSQTPIYLSETDARAFSVSLKSVKFSDGSVYSADDNADTVCLSTERLSIENQIYDADALDEYRQTVCPKAKYSVKKEHDLWYCSCGATNRNGEEICHYCGASLEKKESIDVDELRNEHIYKSAVSLFTASESIQNPDISNVSINNAKALLGQYKSIQSNYETAIAKFESLGDYKDSAEMAEKCRSSLAAFLKQKKKSKRKNKIIASFLIGVPLLVATFVIFINPTIKLNNIKKLIDEGKYAEASEITDSFTMVLESHNQENNALKIKIFEQVTLKAGEMVKKGKYQEAYNFLSSIDGYKYYGKEWMEALENALNKKYAPLIKAFNLTSFTIPSGVTSIGVLEYQNCTNLTSIAIPSGVTSIERSAFEGCTALTSVVIPDSVTTIGESAFEECTSLTSVTIPENVTSIGEKAFYNCTALSEIKFNAKSCTDFTNSNRFWNAGKNTDGITVTFGDNVEKIPAYCFGGENVKAIVLGSKVESIGDYAFDNCRNLTSITFSDSLTSIGAYAFYYCKNLTTVTIPNGVTNIGNSAFSGCTKLTSISIPDSVTSIGYSAFYDTVYYNNEANWTNGVLYIGKCLIKAKSSISGAYTIKSGTRCIAGDAFDYCDELTSITIPNSVITIGNSAFSNCDSLKTVTMGNSVTKIGSYAFCDCGGYYSVKIQYRGSQSQWNAILKGDNWDKYTTFTITYNYTGT